MVEGDWASDTDEGVIQVSCVVWLCLVRLWHKACVGETVQSWTNLFCGVGGKHRKHKQRSHKGASLHHILYRLVL